VERAGTQMRCGVFIAVARFAERQEQGPA